MNITNITAMMPKAIQGCHSAAISMPNIIAPARYDGSSDAIRPFVQE
jgi:hypothetical protein